MMNRFPLIVGAIVALAFLVGCGGRPSSNQIQDTAQERLNRQAIRAVGLPGIHNFFEKREYKSIYEMRDKAISTYTYLVDRYGKLHKLCDSVGYGIPYATQYTAPMSLQREDYGSRYHVLPQEDPNGLYSPASASGTWVLCLNPETKKISPVYSEPNILVSQFPMQTQSLSGR